MVNQTNLRLFLYLHIHGPASLERENHSDQPDTQDHLRQNIEVVDAHSLVQEALQILECHREPKPIHEPAQSFCRNKNDRGLLE